MAENKKQEDNQENLQEKYMQFQALQEQMKQINEHLEKVGERINDISGIIENVDEISKIKEDNEILVPISNGIFIKAKTEGSDKFLVNVGSKTVVEKNKEEVKKLLEKQKVELAELQNKMMVDLNTAETEAVGLQEELQKIMS